jgi:hypothetical protein
LEGSELFAEPRLAQLASHDRGFDANASVYILEYQAVAMRPNHDAKSGTNIVYAIPAPQLGRAKSRPEFFPGPAREAFDFMVGLAIRSPLRESLAVAHS